MPCRCDGYPEPEPDLHNGPLAEMLCRTMADHEVRGEMECFTPAQLAWWVGHKKRDLERVMQDLREAEQNKDREKALAKLTDYERSLLGV